MVTDLYITDESKSVIVNMAKAIREQVGHDQAELLLIPKGVDQFMIC